MNCEEASRILSEAQDRRLTLREKLILNVHLGICNGCRRFGQQVKLLRHISQQFSKPDPSAKDKPD